MMKEGFGERFAKEWVEAWNSHDLERVLAHYEDDFEMSSPIIVTLMGERSGKLKGKAAVGAYWAKALKALPGLRFELLTVLAGTDSVSGKTATCAPPSRITRNGPRSESA